MKIGGFLVKVLCGGGRGGKRDARVRLYRGEKGNSRPTT